MIKFFTSLILVIALLLSSTLLPLPAFAASNDKLFSSCSQAPNSPVCKDKNTTENPAVDVIASAANIIAILTGLAAVIMIIISGLTMITSGGNQETVTNARKRLVAALIGLVIVVLAWTITRFVIDKVLG